MRKILLSILVTASFYLFPLKASADEFFPETNQPTNTLVDLAEKALSSTVFIAIESNPFDASFGCDPTSFYEYFRPIYERFWPPTFYHGSGFIISPDGYIVTNHHVVENATSVLVALQDASFRVFKASVIGSDPRTDIAVLKIENNDDFRFPYLKFGNSNNSSIGEQVMSIGNPLNSKIESTVTMGVISGKDRNNFGLSPIEGYIQTDASINGGNSGGPLLNLDGEVIGVICWGYSHFWGSEGIGFAIPSHSAKHVANQIISKGVVSQGFLGVKLEESQESAFNRYYFDVNEGAQVKEVIKNSPAERVGLEVGDVIIEVNHCPIRSPLSLKNQICILEPKTKILLTIQRQGNLIEKKIKLGSEELSKTHSSFFKSNLVI